MRGSARGWLLSLLMAAGCAGHTPHSAPPGAPLRATQSPVPALRARVEAGDLGEVVLDDRDGLSPDEAAVLALDHNPRLRATRAERGMAEAELLAAGILPNPRLEGTVDVPVAGTDATVLGYGGALSWDVSPLIARGARVDAAEGDVARVDLEIAWEEWQVALSARLHALRAVYLERRIEVAREIEQGRGQRLDALRRARVQGAVTDIEVTDGERSAAEARVSRLALERELVSERAALGRSIGVDDVAEVRLDTSWAPPSGGVDADALLDELPRRRLDLVALARGQRSRDAAVRAAVLSQFPAIEIGVHAAREVDEIASAGVTLGIDIPLFDRRQDAVARARAQRARLEAEYHARVLEARTNVIRLARELELARAQLEAARQASDAATRLAELGQAAAVSGAMTPVVATGLGEDAQQSRLRVLEIEQGVAELRLGLAAAAGVDW